MKNKYIKHSHIGESKFKTLLKCYCDEKTVEETVDLTKLSRPTVVRIINLIRERIASICERNGKLSGEVEIDESYLGPRRIRGKRGRGARGKTPVIGLLKRNGQVYTKIVKNCTRKQLLPIIKGKILDDATVYKDGWKSYDGLILNGYKHYRIYHSKNEFARGKNHINGIESFWSYTKRRLNRMNGVRKDKFMLHLKESEYRWNNRDKNTIYKQLLKEFRANPLAKVN